MKKINLILSILVLLIGTIKAQEAEQYKLEIEPISITNVPGIHSYVWARDSKNRILVMGGRIDGLHQRQPFAAFLEKDNNKSAFVIDIENENVYDASISDLDSSLFEQIQSTNQEFYQRGNTLYIFGGYGYSNTLSKHVTFPYLTAVNVDSLTEAVVNGNPITNHFRQLEDSAFCVTGGQVGYLDSLFYLVGGQLFDGSYNPMGPDHGPGFFQEYTDEIRKFKINDDGSTLKMADYTATFDTDELHRRDYNMTSQFFSNGERGFTVFSGVFQKTVDLPFLNTVDITPSSYAVKDNFNQYLSQYHCAKMPMYDSVSNTMQTIFFGGMSQYTLDADQNLVEDQNVPFVKTISKVSRNADGSMDEIKLPIDMPTLVGSGAEFIPYYGAPFWDNEILKINEVPQEKTLVGYIYGGIESTGENIFFTNDGSQSSASSVIFKVYINKSTVGINEDLILNGDNVFGLKIFPNPVKKNLNIEFFNPNKANLHFDILDTSGKEIRKNSVVWTGGNGADKINVSELSAGTYIFRIGNGMYSSQKTFVKH